MGRGTHRGFITYEELNKSLGKRNLSNQNLSQAFIHILDEGVTLVEKKSDYKVLRKKESSSKEEGKTIDKSDDPIRMYLREMGGVELLEDISRDLMNYDLEFRIQELESKFSVDMSETTFNELKELKKKQNLN